MEQHLDINVKEVIRRHQKNGKIMDTSRTGVTGQTMDAKQFAHAGCFFFFPIISLFLAGITGWRQLDLQGGFFD